MKHEEFLNELLNDPAFADRYSTHKGHLKFLISKMLVDARHQKGMTQKDLAEALETTQSSIARLESGAVWPKLEFLRRIADVYQTDLIPPRFEFMRQPFEEVMRRAHSKVLGVIFAAILTSMEDTKAPVPEKKVTLKLNPQLDTRSGSGLSSEKRYEHESLLALS